eukprot:COSAG01_NODE_2896_length_6894_cov_4.250147_9_plen_44_part_00
MCCFRTVGSQPQIHYDWLRLTLDSDDTMHAVEAGESRVQLPTL